MYIPPGLRCKSCGGMPGGCRPCKISAGSISGYSSVSFAVSTEYLCMDSPGILFRTMSLSSRVVLLVGARITVF